VKIEWSILWREKIVHIFLLNIIDADFMTNLSAENAPEEFAAVIDIVKEIGPGSIWNVYILIGAEEPLIMISYCLFGCRRRSCNPANYLGYMFASQKWDRTVPLDATNSIYQV